MTNTIKGTVNRDEDEVPNSSLPLGTRKSQNDMSNTDVDSVALSSVSNSQNSSEITKLEG